MLACSAASFSCSTPRHVARQEQQQRWAPAPAPLRTAAAPRRLAAAAGGGDSTDEALSSIAGNPLFNNSQFMGVLQNSLARQGPDALTSAPPAEPREDATVEVLTSALNQSKITLQQLVMWQNQLAAQIAAQQKQVSRMEFALNKSRNDAAYLRAMKELMHGDL